LGANLTLVLTDDIGPLLAAGGPDTFVLIQKCPKNQVSRNASLPHGPLPCKTGRTTGGEFCAARSCSLRKIS